MLGLSVITFLEIAALDLPAADHQKVVDTISVLSSISRYAYCNYYKYIHSYRYLFAAFVYALGTPDITGDIK